MNCLFAHSNFLAGSASTKLNSMIICSLSTLNYYYYYYYYYYYKI